TTTKAQTFMWKVKLVQGVITQIIQTHGNGIDVTSINRQVYITGLQSEATIQVYDMLGKLVQVIQNVQNNQALTINNSGVSILNVSTFTQQTQAKVFVK
ncbi:MAG TPA: T9SS type A sorting domain-containing protein, partial [Paludibacteraceae bacterium]|nr:T9SS type A sorting domain-containing protein [Paludibacteraceae bacterium]